MADILIRMEMPESCSYCPMCYDMIECTVSPLQFWYGRPENEQFDFCNERHPLCPLHELPEHGDLIDRGAFDADCRKRYCTDCDNSNGVKCRACWVDDMLGDVADFETVIPSNKEETEWRKSIEPDMSFSSLCSP